MKEHGVPLAPSPDGASENLVVPGGGTHTDTPRIGAPCDGSATCPAQIHMHGCFRDYGDREYQAACAAADPWIAELKRCEAALVETTRERDALVTAIRAYLRAQPTSSLTLAEKALLAAIPGDTDG